MNELSLTVRRDVQENDEEAVRVKEQSILELGTLLAKTGQAAGNHSVPDFGLDLMALILSSYTQIVVFM